VAPTLDVVRETARLDELEAAKRGGVVPLPGAADLVRSIPPGRWAVVTSGSLEVATHRLGVAGVPSPEVLVTARDVRLGKPHPDGYLAAAGRLGLAPLDCVVVEDAPAGVAAGKSVGMRVIAVMTTHGREALAPADLIVAGPGALRASVMSTGELVIRW
jgi:mannitol-1-/sugar-/sorbitol-6-phosphatase